MQTREETELQNEQIIRSPGVKLERDEYGQQVHENTQRQHQTRIEEKRLSLAVLLLVKQQKKRVIKNRFITKRAVDEKQIP